jgi:NAD(P)-dependent dehydrogenase (short-subunit alcohol dehydrogenase family)
VLGDQATAEQDPAAARAVFETDFLSAAAWCLAAANHLASRRTGALVVIGSVAGDRGRMSNYIYGAAKGGLGILVQGIAHRLAPTGARAVLIKPGFVDTPMTAGIAPKGILWSRPEAVAAVVKRAAERGGPIVYAPWWWRLVMLVIGLVPARIFHQTKL